MEREVKIMRQETINIYKFEELGELAKDQARDWWRMDVIDYEWWDCTYEDAATIGLEITSFDLDRNKHAKGVIDSLGCSHPEVAELIQRHHGKECKTCILATEYLNELKTRDDFTEEADSEGAFEEYREEYDDIFLKQLLSLYADMLQSEHEHINSDEYIDEMMTINDYEFTEDGAIFV